jgi:hypothetical protein
MENEENCELLLYPVSATTSLNGTARSRYSDKQLKNKFKKVLPLPSNHKFDKYVNFAINFIDIFLAMNNSRIKKLKKKTTIFLNHLLKIGKEHTKNR